MRLRRHRARAHGRRVTWAGSVPPVQTLEPAYAGGSMSPFGDIGLARTAQAATALACTKVATKERTISLRRCAGDLDDFRHAIAGDSEEFLDVRDQLVARFRL